MTPKGIRQVAKSNRSGSGVVFTKGLFHRLKQETAFSSSSESCILSSVIEYSSVVRFEGRNSCLTGVFDDLPVAAVEEIPRGAFSAKPPQPRLLYTAFGNTSRLKYETPAQA